ncbi:MAG: squalene/phytoene synthase family protein [Pseudomonadota bacterium]
MRFERGPLGLCCAMSIEACALNVQKGDPDRFAATMTLPLHQRGPLFVLYAFNLEIARASWVTAEPLIARMRLQWWSDALDEVYGGGVVRAHEVATPLARVLRAQEVPRALLDRMIAARIAESEGAPDWDTQAFWAYLGDSAGAILGAGAALLGAPAPDARMGAALGLARYWEALPALRAAGRAPSLLRGGGDPDETALHARITDLSSTAIEGLRGAPVVAPQVAVLRSGWLARGVLRRAQAQPSAVLSGQIRPSPFRAHLSLGLATMRGRWEA